MATISNPEQDQQQQGVTPPQGTVAPTQAGGGTGGARSVGTSPSTASSTTPGTPATNVSQYLAANGPQIQQFGQNVTGQLNNQYGQTTSDINAAGTNFGQQVQAGYTAPNASIDQQVASNPTAFVATPGNVQAFQAQANDQYTGPSQFETAAPYAGLESEIASAQNNATPWTSFAGTQAQLQGLGDTTQGEQSLDAALLAGNPGVESSIQAAAAPYANLPSYLAGVAAPADASVATAQAAAQQAQVQAGTAIGTANTNLNNSLASELTDAQTAESQYNTNINNEAAQAAAVQQVINEFPGLLSSLGASWTQGQPPAYNAPVLPNTVAAPTQANVATPADYANAAALAELAGTPETALNPANAPQAGTFNVPTFTNQINPTVAAYLQSLQQTQGALQVRENPQQDVTDLNTWAGQLAQAAGLPNNAAIFTYGAEGGGGPALGGGGYNGSGFTG
jgi:uncharacterized protein YpmS